MRSKRNITWSNVIGKSWMLDVGCCTNGEWIDGGGGRHPIAIGCDEGSNLGPFGVGLPQGGKGWMLDVGC